jgi:hypothetical protein
VGKIRLWIEMLDKEESRKIQRVNLKPTPRYDFELRVIIWQTKNCVFKDQIELCNDLFVKGTVANQIP